MNSNRIWLFAMILVVLVSSTALFAKGNKETKNDVVTFLTIDAVNFRGILETFIEEFEQANPGVTVEANFSSNLGTQVSAAVNAGDEPDIIFMWSSGLTGYVQQKTVAQLPENFEKKVRNNLFDYSLSPAENDGKLYAVPYNFYPSFGTVMYNIDLFDKAGITPPTKAPESWDDLMLLAQKLTVRDATGTIVQAGFSARDRFNGYWFSWILQSGGKIFNDDGTAAFNNAIGREAFNRYVDMYTRWKVDSPEFGSPISEFKKGTAAMTLGMPWLTSILKKDVPNLRFGFFPMPTIDGSKPLWPFYELWMHTVSQKSANKQAVWDFLDYLIQPAQAARFSAFSGEISSVKEASNLPEVKNSAILAPFIPLMPFGIDSGFHRWQGGDVSSYLRTTMPESVLFGKATVDEAIEAAAKEVNRINGAK